MLSADLLNEAYGLTVEEVDLLWKTAPPRMPRFPYWYSSNALCMEVTDCFRRRVLENPDRSGITREMCERVVESGEPVVRQPNGRFAIWGRPEGRDLYLRVVVTGDRSALHNAFFDTGFTPQ